MATAKQKAASRKNIKKAQAAKKKAAKYCPELKPHAIRIPKKLAHKGRVQTPLDRIKTLI